MIEPKTTERNTRIDKRRLKKKKKAGHGTKVIDKGSGGHEDHL